jgi:hypothetical protein
MSVNPHPDMFVRHRQELCSYFGSASKRQKFRDARKKEGNGIVKAFIFACSTAASIATNWGRHTHRAAGVGGSRIFKFSCAPWPARAVDEPTTGICALARIGHSAAALPRRLMNSRRRIGCPRGSDRASYGSNSPVERHLPRVSLCPLWVKSRHVQRKTLCPFYPCPLCANSGHCRHSIISSATC